MCGDLILSGHHGEIGRFTHRSCRGEKDRYYFFIIILWLNLYNDALLSFLIFENCSSVLMVLLSPLLVYSWSCCWGSRLNYMSALDSITGLSLTSFLAQGSTHLWPTLKVIAVWSLLPWNWQRSISVQLSHLPSCGLLMFCPTSCFYFK